MLSEVESEITQLHQNINDLKRLLSEIAQKLPELKAEKAKAEDVLKNEQRRLGVLKNKEERMKSALGKLNDNMNTLLSASKSFEAKAISQTAKTSSSIEKCMDVIDEYLNS